MISSDEMTVALSGVLARGWSANPLMSGEAVTASL
jgi:hypothetical protein